MGRNTTIKDRIAKFLGFGTKAIEQFDSPYPKGNAAAAAGAGASKRFWSKRSSPVSTAQQPQQPNASLSAPVDITSIDSSQNIDIATPSNRGPVSKDQQATPANEFKGNLQGLDSQQLANLTAEDRDQALHRLVTQLQSGSAEHRAHAAEALFNSTSEDELARQKIAALGVVEPLVQMLKQGTDQGQMYAAYTLSALTSIDMSRTDMREHGAIPALLDILRLSTFLVSKKGAMRALGRLARNDDAAAEIVRLGGLPPIIELLQSDDSSLIRRCLIALYFIGADKELLQAEIAKAGAVPLLVRLCKSDNAEVQAEAADVLKVLARNPDCATVIFKAGGNEALQYVAQHGLHPKSKNCAVKALQRLAEVEEFRQTIINTGGSALLNINAEANEVQELAQIVQQGNQWVKAQAAEAIAEVWDEDPRYSRDLAASGVLKPLVHLLEHGTPDGRASAACALAKMSNDLGVREDMIKANAVPHLLHAVLELRAKGQEGAATAIEKLASHPTAAKQMINEGAVMALLSAMEYGSALAQARAARALFMLSGVDNKVLNQLVEHDGIAVLVRRCWRGNAQVKAIALALLRECANVSAHEPLLLAAGALPALLVLQSSADAEVRELATSTLSAWLKTPELTAAAAAERELQDKVTSMLNSVQQHTRMSAIVEEAFRIIPRGIFVTATRMTEAWKDTEVLITLPSISLPPPHIDAAVLTALDLRPGQSFLDIGSGSGFFTCCGAYIVGHAGSCIGFEIDEDVCSFAQNRAQCVRTSRLLNTPIPTFVNDDFLTLLEAGDTYDKVHIGAYVPRPWLATLMRLVARGGKMVVPVDDKILLLSQGKDLETAELIGRYTGYQPLQLPSARPTNFTVRGRKPSASVGPQSKSKMVSPMQRSSSAHARRGNAINNNAAAAQQPLPSPKVPAVPRALPAGRPRQAGRANSTEATNECAPSSSGGTTAGAMGNGHIDAAHARNPSASDMQQRGGRAPSASPNNGMPDKAGKGGGERGGGARGNKLVDSSKDDGTTDADKERINKEIEEEQMNGLLMTMDDIEICRNAEGKKCRLGEGGFGVVYKALMNGVDEVAVKLVKADQPSPKEMDLFLKEVRTLSKLHHRNIVQFYGACLEPGSMFFVTELMKGGDLYSALRNHPDTMRWDKLGKKVALDVALGINYLHARKPPMMHRDLKSPNVLLSEEGVAKIADVGMVRSQVKDLVTAQPVMTPLWAAPEVMRHERASIKADIWSYGILIWELVSGEDITEFQPLAISKQMGAHNKGKVMVLPNSCPPVARMIFEQCCNVDPDMRPSAQQIVEWLRYDR